LHEYKYQKRMFSEPALAPPPGFRKAIPDKVKLKVVVIQGGACATCSEKLGTLEDTQFDHFPALQLRSWDPEARDTIPPSNDEGYVFAKHVDCHAAKTFGSKASKRGADVTEIARTRRIAKESGDFRRRMLRKFDPETELEPPKRPKKQWPKRSFARRGKKGGSRPRDQEGDAAADG
jgi:hypothetical protein